MPKFQPPHPWADEKGLVSLVDELVRRIPSDVASIQLRRALAVIERAAPTS
jgi:hypothetical protein